MGRVRAWIKSCWVGSRRERVRDVTIATTGIPKIRDLTEFRQPLQVQSHLEMPRILVQLGHTQRT